jgi:hypothetical protein
LTLSKVKRVIMMTLQYYRVVLAVNITPWFPVNQLSATGVGNW